MQVKKTRICIDALYVVTGGGLVLLNYLIEQLKETNIELYLLLDKRNKSDYSYLGHDRIILMKPSIIQRHGFYKQQGHLFDIVFTFNNLPPSVQLKNAIVYTYFQQVLYLRNKGYGYNAKISTLLWLKKKYIGYYISNTNFFIVQTTDVQRQFCDVFNINERNVLVLPFFKENKGNNKVKKDLTNPHFVYVSDGNPHKNHYRLLKAWERVNRQYPDAKLTLTVSQKRYPVVSQEIERMRMKGVNVENVGFKDQNGVIKLYTSHPYLIYPSLTESFGLGLIEAADWGCEVIASDLNYVNSIIFPMKTFDPYDVGSIAQNVLEVLMNPYQQGFTKPKVKNSINELVQLITSDVKQIEHSQATSV